MTRSPCLLVPSLLVALATPTPAADFNLDITARGIHLGKPVCGPQLSESDLTGHVVLVEFWGIHCAPCLESMPGLARLYEELGPAGLVVIGAHVQRGTPEEVRAMAEALGVAFAVTESARVDGGTGIPYIPHCMLFDHTGKCLYRGSPDEALHRKVRETVGAALVAATGKAKFVRLTAIVDGLKKGQPPIPLLHKAAPLVTAADPATAEEAKLLAAKLNELGQRQIGEASQLKASDPAAAYFKLQKTAADFKGTVTARQANDELGALRRDRKVMAEVDAHKAFNVVRKIDLLLNEAPGHEDPKGTAFQRANAAVLKQLQSALRQMKRSWPETKATREGLAIGEKYGVAVH